MKFYFYSYQKTDGRNFGFGNAVIQGEYFDFIEAKKFVKSIYPGQQIVILNFQEINKEQWEQFADN